MEAKVVVIPVLELKALIADAVTAAIKYSPLTAPTPPLPDEEKPLNVEQAADFLGVAPQTVYQNIKKLKHRKRFGKLYFFRSELIAYLEGGANK